MCPNQKPWLTGEVHNLLRARNAAFRVSVGEGLRTARANLSRDIRKAKKQYAKRTAHTFRDSRDTRRLWKGFQTITDYKPPPQTSSNTTPAQKIPPPYDNQVLYLSPASVMRSFSKNNARKAAGPDNIPGRELKDCTGQLKDVFTDIFNFSLSQAVVPTCFKATTIIPIPKKPSPSVFNDYRPVVLTPIITKCFEWLVLAHLKTCLPPTLDTCQFAYRKNRSTEDAISITLHSVLSHLDNKDTYARILFLDFSTEFNTVIPSRLILKFKEIGYQYFTLQLAFEPSDQQTPVCSVRPPLLFYPHS
ncbi:hypothetical protein PO909_013647 [Leuciscus waleckii]